MTSRTRTVLLVLLLVSVGAVLGGFVKWRNGRATAFAVGSVGNVGGQVSLQNGFEPVVKKVLPTVVNIASSKVVKSPLLSDPLFRQFFENNFGRQFRAPREQRQQSLGSGVITTQDGYILTNSHVVEGADDVKISLSDRREFDAKVIGTDNRSDLAVIKINAKDLPFASFGAPDRVNVGDFALAIGNPFGVGQTVTMGIISATGRGGLGIEDYEDFIQTDAAINPGNSGGALVNVNGTLIGINTAILTGGGGGSQGVGFAIPMTMARNVMDQIIKTGKVVRGWLGVSVQTMNRDMAKAFNLPGEPRGALIGDVTPQSPAEKVGLRKGDIILVVDGTELRDSRQLSLRISQMSPGNTVKLRIFRDGKETEHSVTLGEMPARESGEALGAVKPDSGSRLGIAVEPLTPSIKQELKLPASTTGLVIAEIEPGSAAAEAGLQPGDIIQEVNRKPIEDVTAFQQLVRSAKEPLLLLVNRRGSHRFVTVQPR